MRVSGNEKIIRRYRLNPLCAVLRRMLCLLPVLLFLLSFTDYCFADEFMTIIKADSLEYSSETKTYRAEGSVEIEHEDATLRTDAATFYEESGDAVAEGTVRYDDSITSIKAERAELNLEAETGKLYDAEVFFREDNYHFTGKEIEKRGEDYFYSPEATFTSCDSPVPEWCFKVKNAELVLGERIKARDVSFRIKNVPVLYAPYLWVPIRTERETGFLMPTVGYSSSRGIRVNIPFFWAIAEDRDATFVIDTFSKRGVGKGIEYRFIKPGGIKSNWWAYHIRDTELDKDFLEIKASHEQRSKDRLGGYLDINYVNEENFYREYSPYLEVRAQRFLQSTGELNVPFENARMYLLSQYWVDLKNETEEVPQKLPEFGYVLNYSGLGNLLFSSTVNASHLWRDDGLSSVRLDVYPRMLYSAGKDFVLSQIAALRGTVYSFYQNEDITDDSLDRFAFEYDLHGHTRFARRYGSLMHVIEPSIRYHLILSTEDDIPVFDITEIYEETSMVELSILNRLVVRGEETFTLRITQPIDTYEDDHPFLPLKFELGMNKPLPIRVDATYDVDSGELETLSSDVGFRILNAQVSLGSRYNRIEDIKQYKVGVGFRPFQSLLLAGRIWYDAEENETTELGLGLTYLKQCWGVQVDYIKEPDDYAVRVMFELAGLFTNITRR